MKIKKKFIWIFVVILLLLVLIGLILVLKLLDSDNESNEVIKKMDLSFESRVKNVDEFQNDDYFNVGWLQVQGTNIDLPILDYRSSSKNEEIDYSYGWRSGNYISGGNREVLVGHNVLNVSSTPMLSNENLMDFESLMSFVYYSFAKDNLYVQYTKNGKDELYLIYAIGFYDYYYDGGETITDPEQLKEYIKEARESSIYDYDVEVDENDTLLSVKTCTRYFGVLEKQQFVLNLRKIRANEEVLHYNVITNENFEKLISNTQIN